MNELSINGGVEVLFCLVRFMQFYFGFIFCLLYKSRLILEVSDKHTGKEEMRLKENRWEKRLLTRNSGLSGN